MDNHPTLEVGKAYYFDNPSAKSYVGIVTHIIDPFCVALKEATWIAESGRFNVFLREGQAPNMEVEYAGDVPCCRFQSVNVWNHPVWTKQPND